MGSEFFLALNEGKGHIVKAGGHAVEPLFKLHLGASLLYLIKKCLKWGYDRMKQKITIVVPEYSKLKPKRCVSLVHFIFIFLYLFYQKEKNFKETKIKVCVHKMFYESLILSGDLERE